jgi:hypothetical protein
MFHLLSDLCCIQVFHVSERNIEARPERRGWGTRVVGQRMGRAGSLRTGRARPHPGNWVPPVPRERRGQGGGAAGATFPMGARDGGGTGTVFFSTGVRDNEAQVSGHMLLSRRPNAGISQK